MTDITNDLNQLLADHQVFYQKCRIYHWTVQGPLFFALHQKFEELYTEAALRVDELAERIVALGGRPIGTLAKQVSTSRLGEDGEARSAKAMVQNLIDDLEKLTLWLRETAADAGEANDSATLNMLEGFADANGKTMWMLRAFLAD
ncbi:MAG: DNA starvation/stationary phase protection protein [Planctomycetes bacterium]|nr:DNA starvation/stationary phase protection protein [Planctomycetota bacterium]